MQEGYARIPEKPEFCPDVIVQGYGDVGVYGTGKDEYPP